MDGTLTYTPLYHSTEDRFAKGLPAVLNALAARVDIVNPGSPFHTATLPTQFIIY